MLDDPKNILLRILEIIGFTNDKNKFVNEFIKNVYLQSISNLIQSLPVENQKKLKEDLLKNQNNTEKITDTLKVYFPEQQIQKALTDAVRKAVENYIQTIAPVLSESQRNNLTKLFQELRLTTSIQAT